MDKSNNNGGHMHKVKSTHKQAPQLKTCHRHLPWTPPGGAHVSDSLFDRSTAAMRAEEFPAPLCVYTQRTCGHFPTAVRAMLKASSYYKVFCKGSHVHPGQLSMLWQRTSIIRRRVLQLNIQFKHWICSVLNLESRLIMISQRKEKKNFNNQKSLTHQSI